MTADILEFKRKERVMNVGSEKINLCLLADYAENTPHFEIQAIIDLYDLGHLHWFGTFEAEFPNKNGLVLIRDSVQLLRYLDDEALNYSKEELQAFINTAVENYKQSLGIC